MCLLAHTFNDIRTKLQRLSCETAKVDLKINISKIKEISIHTPNNQSLLLNDQQIEQVSEFPYLGCIISKDNGGADRDVAERIKNPEARSERSIKSGDLQHTPTTPKSGSSIPM
jgi:hypothetical protein